jgi:hypothetical protein
MIKTTQTVVHALGRTATMLLGYWYNVPHLHSAPHAILQMLPLFFNSIQAIHPFLSATSFKDFYRKLFHWYIPPLIWKSHLPPLFQAISPPSQLVMACSSFYLEDNSQSCVRWAYGLLTSFH